LFNLVTNLKYNKILQVLITLFLLKDLQYKNIDFKSSNKKRSIIKIFSSRAGYSVYGNF